MFLAFFSNLDQALNPLGLSRLEMKLQVREIHSRVELLSQQQVLLSQNFQLVAQRLGNMERDLSKLCVMFDQQQYYLGYEVLTADARRHKIGQN